MFDFYPELPHIHFISTCTWVHVHVTTSWQALMRTDEQLCRICHLSWWPPSPLRLLWNGNRWHWMPVGITSAQHWQWYWHPQPPSSCSQKEISLKKTTPMWGLLSQLCEEERGKGEWLGGRGWKVKGFACNTYKLELMGKRCPGFPSKA